MWRADPSAARLALMETQAYWTGGTGNTEFTSSPGLLADAYLDAILTVDGLQQALYSNERASLYLETGFLIYKAQSGRLAFLDAEAQAFYVQAIDGLAQDRSRFTTFEIRGSCRPTVHVSIRAADPTVRVGPALIVLRNLDETNALRVTRATQEFFLTPSEARVLHATLSGMSPQDCATNTGLKISTVRTQLAALFAKTETSGQASLIVKIMQAPVF